VSLPVLSLANAEPARGPYRFLPPGHRGAPWWRRVCGRQERPRLPRPACRGAGRARPVGREVSVHPGVRAALLLRHSRGDLQSAQIRGRHTSAWPWHRAALPRTARGRPRCRPGGTAHAVAPPVS